MENVDFADIYVCYPNSHNRTDICSERYVSTLSLELDVFWYISKDVGINTDVKNRIQNQATICWTTSGIPHRFPKT